VRSAYVLWNGESVQDHDIVENRQMLTRLTRCFPGPSLLAVEMIGSYGMPVGRDVFETCVWVGRYLQAWIDDQDPGQDCVLVYRKDVKLELCGTMRAKDANVRQALLDLVGPRGTKARPGPTYGLRADEWSALGVAIVAAKRLQEGKTNGTI